MIKIICVGKIKEKFFVDAIDEYKKRISKYSKLEIIEVSDESTDNEKIVLSKEKEKLLKVINKSDYNIVLDIDGKQLSSVELSDKINHILEIVKKLFEPVRASIIKEGCPTPIFKIKNEDADDFKYNSKFCNLFNDSDDFIKQF